MGAIPKYPRAAWPSSRNRAERPTDRRCPDVSEHPGRGGNPRRCRAAGHHALPTMSGDRGSGAAIARLQPGARQRRGQSIIAWEQFFDRWDVLLCPASMTTAFPHCNPGSPLEVDGKEVSYWTVAAHGALFNYTGHPAVVLPYTLDRAGLPIGIQLVGKRWGDSRLLAVAEALAPVTGGFRRPPGLLVRTGQTIASH